MIQVSKFRPRSGRGWFYEGKCPLCEYTSLTESTEADAIRRTEGHINWWHTNRGSETR